jgi:hypothetical protein
MPRKKTKPQFVLPEGCTDDSCKEEAIRKHLGDIYPQLRINELKTCSLASPYLGEILPFIIQQFLEKPIEKQLEVCQAQKLENMVTRMLALQLKSAHSPFYHQVRKFYFKANRNHDVSNDQSMIFEADDEYEDESIYLRSFKEAIEELDLNFYERDMLQKIGVERWTKTKYSKHYGMDIESVRRHYMKMFKAVKKKAKEIVQRYEERIPRDIDF